MGSYIFLAAMLILMWWLNINFAKIKGRIGERQVSKLLDTLDSYNCIHINDLYIPKPDGSTVQIDHILISPKGIFVIETKNYTGWILGSENSQYWKQVIYKRQEKFYNPIWQNASHIKALREFLGDLVDSIPIYSLVVFGRQAEFKFKGTFKKANVIKINQLISVIQNEPETVQVLNQNIQKINQHLSALKLKDKKEQKQQSKHHIKAINNRKTQFSKQVSNNICPQCGGDLIPRNGKHGAFKGCSNFPKCKFTSS